MPDEPPLQHEGVEPLHARYQRLLYELERICSADEESQDELVTCLRSLLAVVGFLEADPAVMATLNTRYLNKLASALRDKVMGGKPGLLSRKSPQAHAPKNQSFGAVQGSCAAAVTLLIEAGEDRPSAARYVAKLLNRHRIRGRDGEVIADRQILRWRAEISGRASDLANSTYHRSLAKLQDNAPPGLLQSRDRVRETVEAMIEAVKSGGF